MLMFVVVREWVVSGGKVLIKQCRRKGVSAVSCVTHSATTRLCATHQYRLDVYKPRSIMDANFCFTYYFCRTLEPFMLSTGRSALEVRSELFMLSTRRVVLEVRFYMCIQLWKAWLSHEVLAVGTRDTAHLFVGAHKRYIYLPPHNTRVRVTANIRLAVRARQQDRPYFNRPVLKYVCVYKESQSGKQPTMPLFFIVASRREACFWGGVYKVLVKYILEVLNRDKVVSLGTCYYHKRESKLRARSVLVGPFS